MKKLLTYCSCFFIIVSCNNKSDKVDDKQPPVILITSPTPGQVFSGGQTANISANITDNSRLVQIHVHISNNGTGQLLVDIHRTPDGPTYVLNETLQVQAGIQYKIQVVAIDNSSNQETQAVLISSN
jgi:hypothetical protein